jgi:hypothetical protein
MKTAYGSFHRAKINTELENTQALKENYNPFKAHMEKVIEIRIYLKYNFHKNDIDEQFINDLEQEYATQFLEKMEFLPTKMNINKILKLRPMEQCDFHLTQEQVRNKPVKLIHIYPNTNINKNNNKGKDKLKILLSNEYFEEKLNQNYQKNNKEDIISKIKKREIKRDELNLFQRENVDNMISDARDEILDKQLYNQNLEMTDKKLLTIDNIRDKYLNPNNKNILEIDLDKKMVAKAKFQNISGAYKNDILTMEKYKFPFLNIELDRNILDEVTKPVDLPVEIIMKDVNFILDNFPIEELIDIDDLEKKEMSKTVSQFKNTSNRKQLYYKIKSVKREDIIYIYKKIQNLKVYRIIGLTLNLIYWIVFGYINRFQIDKATKQYVFFKLLQEIKLLENGFKAKRLYNKIYIPLLILIVRIECENVFTHRFRQLFNKSENRKNALERINELITVIYDPHCYYNTFTIIGGNTSVLKHKLSKKILPSYKSKTYVTSNFVDQLFTKFKSVRNIKMNKEKGMEKELDKDFELDIWKKERKFIADSKTKFFGVLFNNINQNLKKRNLEPIFSIKKGEKINYDNNNNNKDVIKEIENDDEDEKIIENLERKNRTDGFFYNK